MRKVRRQKRKGNREGYTEGAGWRPALRWESKKRYLPFNRRTSPSHKATPTDEKSKKSVKNHKIKRNREDYTKGAGWRPALRWESKKRYLPFNRRTSPLHRATPAEKKQKERI
jgi:hypothetical protein